MSMIILFNMISLDGFFEGPGNNISWHNVDEEFNEFALDQLDSAGGLIFGRVTYQMMASYWPSPMAIETDPTVASKMNSIPKIVFSKQLEQADWNNTRLVRADPVEEITKLKQQPGKPLFVFGSANLASSLIRKGLMDEFRVMINPVILGGGTPLFQGIHEQLRLTLEKTKAFRNGNVLLFYKPKSEIF